MKASSVADSKIESANLSQLLPTKFNKRMNELTKMSEQEGDDEVQIYAAASNELKHTMPIIRLQSWPPNYLPPNITINCKYYARLTTFADTSFSTITLVEVHIS